MAKLISSNMLVVSENDLNNLEFIQFINTEKLETLDLSLNKISSLRTFSKLQKLPF
jgi:Leucine-rich repeat (LRR) protein